VLYSFGLLTGVGEVAAAGQGVGVCVAQDLLVPGEGGLVQGNGAGRAALSVGPMADGLVDVGEWGVVFGWSGGSEGDEAGCEGLPLVFGRDVLALRRQYRRIPLTA
jgi:hypothetical protein